MRQRLIKNQDREEDVTPQDCTYSRHIVAPVLSGLTKTLMLARVIEETLPCITDHPTISLGIGSIFGAVNFSIQYYYVTDTIFHPGIHIVSMSEDEKQVLTCSDEGKAFLILLSSLSSGLVDACKAYLKTMELDPRLSIGFAFLMFWTQQATHMQAMGQKWLSNDGININDTWAGKIAKFFLLDFEFFYTYIFDLRSLVTKLYPALEAALQFATVFNFGKLVGMSNPYLLISLAVYASYSQYLLHKGLGQDIMKRNLALTNRDHTLLAALVDHAAESISHVLDKIITLPCDLLGSLTSPTHVVTSSNVVAASVNGYSLFAKAITHLPELIKPLSKVISPHHAGLIGVPIDMMAQSSRLNAAWEQKITSSDEKSKKEPESIGVKVMLDEKFGEQLSDENIPSEHSCTTRPVNRCSRYLSYMASQVSYCASSISELFGSCKKENNNVPDMESKPINSVQPTSYHSLSV